MLTTMMAKAATPKAATLVQMTTFLQFIALHLHLCSIHLQVILMFFNSIWNPKRLPARSHLASGAFVGLLALFSKVSDKLMW